MTTADWMQLLMVFAGGQLVGHILQHWRERQDASSKLLGLIDARVKTILEDDEKTIRRLQGEMRELQLYVVVLVAALEKAGITVPPRPQGSA